MFPFCGICIGQDWSNLSSHAFWWVLCMDHTMCGRSDRRKFI